MKQVRKLKLSQLSKNELEKKRAKKNSKAVDAAFAEVEAAQLMLAQIIQEIFILRVVDMDGVTNLF